MGDLFDDWEKFRPAGRPTKSKEKADEADRQIVQSQKDIRYLVREYPAEVVVMKYLKGLEEDENELFVPDYQRDLIWPDRNQMRFIESLLMGMPIPYLFVADVNDDDPTMSGRLEIVDGVQRVRTLAEFLTNKLVLSGLEKLDALNGFSFDDLPLPRQRRVRRTTLRVVELSETVTEDVRRDLFDRINTGSVKLATVEIRRGIEKGPFLEFVTELAKDPLLRKLAPVPEGLRKRFEYEELVTRFFAFLNRYEKFGFGPEGKVVADFLLRYVKDTNVELQGGGRDALLKQMRDEWDRMLRFVEAHFPDGFQKTKGGGRKVPRVRFEALSVGVGLALREREDLNVGAIPEWLAGNEFKRLTTSDASNNRANLKGRLEFVRDELLRP
ncbi:DUF262 domain-containing protein [Rhodopseudomonas sp. BR0G17]|uniref:DUF262 domain-containing protein n=1 Tax=Rhodopseudomonas sp. BR0G17 TaxID=2269368 RepID=UPI0013E01786|nr:DUF262 domain-containing protein [Rhodopseudomonas sp. BR0G17]NEW97168.1 DUF262 domain-containing protein [Rhodopseudomonas sp. BR0G17]